MLLMILFLFNKAFLHHRNHRAHFVLLCMSVRHCLLGHSIDTELLAWRSRLR